MKQKPMSTALQHGQSLVSIVWRKGISKGSSSICSVSECDFCVLPKNSFCYKTFLDQLGVGGRRVVKECSQDYSHLIFNQKKTLSHSAYIHYLIFKGWGWFKAVDFVCSLPLPPNDDVARQDVLKKYNTINDFM